MMNRDDKSDIPVVNALMGELEACTSESVTVAQAEAICYMLCTTPRVLNAIDRLALKTALHFASIKETKHERS